MQHIAAAVSTLTQHRWRRIGTRGATATKHEFCPEGN